MHNCSGEMTGVNLSADIYQIKIYDSAFFVEVVDATRIEVPKHFLRKIMKKLVKNSILHSTKGPSGGFALNDRTLSTPLLEIVMITNNVNDIDECVLCLQKCNSRYPCPLHFKVQPYKENLYQLFANTTVGDLVKTSEPDFIESICSSQTKIIRRYD